MFYFLKHFFILHPNGFFIKIIGKRGERSVPTSGYRETDRTSVDASFIETARKSNATTFKKFAENAARNQFLLQLPQYFRQYPLRNLLKPKQD